MANETEIERLVVRLIGDSSSYTQMMSQASNSLDILKNKVSMLAGVIGLTGFAAAGSQAIALASDLEKTSIAFEVMLGSAAKASKMLEEIRLYAAATPFEQAPLRQSAQMLMNYGIAADRVLPTLKMLGEVSAGDQNKLNGLAYAFAQMSAKGKVAGDDLRQMINWGFNPLQEMSRTSGKSMAELTDMMHKGAISIDMLNAAFKSASQDGGRFFGMMDKQSKTLYGLFSTLKDEISQFLTIIGQEIIKKLDLKGVLQNMISLFQLLTEGAKRYGAQLVSLVTIVGSMIGAILAVRSAMLAYSAVLTILTIKEITLKAVSGPAGWAQLAVGIAAAAVVTAKLSNEFSVLDKSAAGAASSIKEVHAAGAGGANGQDSIQALINLQKRMRELQQSAKLMPDVAKAIAGREFKAAGIAGLLGLDQPEELTKAGEAAKKSAEKIKLLNDALGSFRDMQGLIPAGELLALEEKINKSLTNERNNLSGVTEMIAHQRQELQRLKETLNPLETVNRLRSSGASQAAVDELVALQKQTTALTQQKEAVEALAEAKRRVEEDLKSRSQALTQSVMTDAEKLTEALANVYDLYDKGMIDDVTKDRAIQQAMELGKGVGENMADAFKSVMPFDAAVKGSKEVAQHIAEYQAGLIKKPLTDDQKRKDKLQEQATRELEIIRAVMQDMNNNIRNQAGDPPFVLEFSAPGVA